ncbi:MAG: hypothetical protein OXC62_00630 [Aestuariivita sp.]|nr:hypothetical protein [Aestuariivita sp.]
MTFRLRWCGTRGATRFAVRPAGTIARSCQDTWLRSRDLPIGHFFPE